MRIITMDLRAIGLLVGVPNGGLLMSCVNHRGDNHQGGTGGQVSVEMRTLVADVINVKRVFCTSRESRVSSSLF